MKFIKALSSLFDDARIALSFPAFEQEQSVRHAASVTRMFSTSELEAEVIRKMADSTKEAERHFLSPLKRLRDKIRRLEAELDENRVFFAVFSRDFKRELNVLYGEKAAVLDECSSLKGAMAAAYANRAKAAKNLDSWHSKSNRAFFGNRGQRLPNHSLFGQSLGDRDCLKRERESAGNVIAHCKNELDSKYREVELIKERITSAKVAQKAMFDLLQRGLTRQKLQFSIEANLENLKGHQRDASCLQLDFDEFIGAAKHRTGAASVEAEIEYVCHQREVYRRLFSTSDALAKRKAQHRREWLEKRFRTVSS